MAEIFLTIHDAPDEDAVWALITSPTYRLDGYTAGLGLYEEQFCSYNSATHAAEHLIEDLIATGASFDLAERSDNDRHVYYTPALGRFEHPQGDNGWDLVGMSELEALRNCDTIDEVRKRIDALTGVAWQRAFDEMARGRAR